MVGEITKIAVLCIFIGSASIPVGFTITDSPAVVWLGNALGSLLSALVVIYIGDRITSESFKTRVAKRRLGKKVVAAFDGEGHSRTAAKTRGFVNRHGLRLFSLLCPIFPGVLIATATVYLLELDTRTYKRWMCAGVFFVSGLYVIGYWWLFVR